ncbi:hypothetical protein APHAL10511_004905 [Amanita phalloides]|nr:hypothetical protein APHAL10511_004905 [Amanita phalloides]
MSLRRPAPPPPPRRVRAAAAPAANGVAIAEQMASLSLAGPPPPIPHHTRPRLNRLLARPPPPPPLKPTHQPALPARRRLPPPAPSLSTPRPSLPTPRPSLPTPPPEPVPSHDDACIECYDFSAVDAHAALFPRHTVTSLDELSYSLTSPYSSETEKARAIFTWLHHNIAYDAVSFLSGNIRGQSADETLSSGLAVCEGYAGLFCDLVQRAGLQVLKVGGHGKGYGHQALAPGQPAPPYNGNHAWNCVLMDGEWRLIDACWGAGFLNGSTYTQSFNPRFFTSPAAEFGRQHYPEDPSYQLLSEDEGGPVSWQDYILAPEGPQLCKDFYTANLSPVFLQPASKYISLGHPASFHMFKRCQHMSTAEEDNHVYFLHHDNSQIPLQRNAEGGWSVTIPIIKGDIKLCSLSTLNGRNAKGVTVRQFVSSIGRSAMSWQGLATWIAM